jgi:hypothetical protein
VTRELARGAFDRVELLLVRIAPRLPRFAFALARRMGALRRRLSGRWPAAEEVRCLLPHCDATRVAAQIAANDAMNRVLAGAVRRSGIDFLQPLIPIDESVSVLRGPAILTTFHTGSIHALGFALERMPEPVLAFREGTLFTPKGTLTQETTEGDARHRAGTFHRALLRLRAGGLVVLAADVAPGASIQVPFLGRTLPLARGPFALARMSGAPIVPLIARRDGRAIRVLAGDPIAGSDETSLALALGAWLERYVTAHPEDLSVALMNAAQQRAMSKEQ